MNENKLQKKTSLKRMTPQQKSIAARERRHLTWKEKNREKALRWKLFRRGLSEEERLEWEDLKFVEVIAEGRSFMTKEEIEKGITPKQKRRREQERIREYEKEYYKRMKEPKQKYMKEYNKRIKEQKQNM
jgi:hypothetical protein